MIEPDEDAQPASAAGEEPLPEAEAEPFYRGTVVRFWRGLRAGVVRTSSGREIPFELEHAELLGSLAAAGTPCPLQAAMEVGYDVGWTSHGLRVTKLFAVPPRAAPMPGPGGEASERQAGAEGEVPAEELAD